MKAPNAKKTRDELRLKYSRMLPQNKGNATQLIRFYDKHGYLSENQAKLAKRLMAGIRSADIPKETAAQKEDKFFKKEYDEPEIRRKANPKPESYKNFKKSMDSLLNNGKESTS